MTLSITRTKCVSLYPLETNSKPIYSCCATSSVNVHSPPVTSRRRNWPTKDSVGGSKLSVQVNIRVGHGSIILGPNDYLQYSLSVGGIAQGAFSCEHRKPITPINGSGEHSWVLSPAGVPRANLFVLDRGPGVYDAYVVTMLFAQAQAYRLRIVLQPANQLVQDIDFTSVTSSDFYHHPLMVEDT